MLARILGAHHRGPGDAAPGTAGGLDYQLNGPGPEANGPARATMRPVEHLLRLYHGPPGRKGKGLTRRIAAVVAFALTTLAGCTAASNHLSSTPPSSVSGSSSSTTTSLPAVGSTLSLRDGEGSSEEFTVTLLRVVDPARPASASDAPPAGDSLAEVVVKVTGVSGAYNDDAAGAVTILGDDDDTYSAGADRLKGCPKAGLFTVTAGKSVTECVAIVIKKTVRVASVEFTPGGGIGSTIGQWKVG